MLDVNAMTMGEPHDSPHRKWQFRISGMIILSLLLFVTIPAGLLQSITISEGTFPGGTFVYKTTKRDYVAATALETSIGESVGIEKKDFEDRIFSIYLDDIKKVKGGRLHRFASGYLSNDSKSDRSIVDSLLSMNESIKPLTRLELKEIGAEDLWLRLRFKKTSLPKTKAAIVVFPSTLGAVSAIMFQFKILPALRKYATDWQLAHGNKKPSVTIITTCSHKDRLCTHYAPLEKGEPFLLGQPNSDDYLQSLPRPKNEIYETFMDNFVRGKSQEL